VIRRRVLVMAHRVLLRAAAEVQRVRVAAQCSDLWRRTDGTAIDVHFSTWDRLVIAARLVRVDLRYWLRPYNFGMDRRLWRWSRRRHVCRPFPVQLDSDSLPIPEFRCPACRAVTRARFDAERDEDRRRDR